LNRVEPEQAMETVEDWNVIETHLCASVQELGALFEEFARNLSELLGDMVSDAR
jgi:hypothetical protein